MNESGRKGRFFLLVAPVGKIFAYEEMPDRATPIVAQ
jgi:hypothetical protein